MDRKEKRILLISFINNLYNFIEFILLNFRYAQSSRELVLVKKKRFLLFPLQRNSTRCTHMLPAPEQNQVGGSNLFVCFVVLRGTFN